MSTELSVIVPDNGAEPTVTDVILLYLDHVALRKQLGTISEASDLKVTRYLNSFRDRFGTQRISQCRSADFTRWLLEHPTWRSDSTKNDALTSVLVAFKWAAGTAQRLIPFNPYSRPDGLKIHPRPRKAIEPEQYRALIDGARNRPGRRKCPSATVFRCALYFLWRTGARTCEMRSALFRDVDGKSGVLRLRHHKTETVTGEDRVIGLDDRVLRLIARLERGRLMNGEPCDCDRAAIDPHQVGEHVFINGWRTAWNKDSFARLFKTFARRAGLPKTATAYCLRHGFCVEAILAGVPERAIADQMGHSSTKQIAWYGRQSRQRADHLQDVVRITNRAR